MIHLLNTPVGSPISYHLLAQNLQVSDKTTKRWLEILEDMYVIFQADILFKKFCAFGPQEPKYYFYDVASTTDPAARLENLVVASKRNSLQTGMCG